MIAPSAQGFTVKERLRMLWEHKREYVLCLLGMIIGGILLFALFLTAQIKTLYHKMSGDKTGDTITNVFVVGQNGTNTNGTAGNGTVVGNATVLSNSTSATNSTNATSPTGNQTLKKHDLFFND